MTNYLTTSNNSILTPNSTEIQGRVLIVDDEPLILEQTAVWLRRNKFLTVTVDNAEDALKIVRAQPFDLVVSDINMPGMNGLEFLNQLKLIDPSLASVIITGDGRVSMAVKAMKSGALGFVPKPFTPAELLETIKVAMRGAKVMRESFEMEFYVPMLQSACNALLKAFEAKDKPSEGHSERVAEHASRIATALKLPPQQVQDIYLGALFHDIGKIGIHDDILLKPSKLSDEEFAEMSKHPEIGAKIISPVEGMVEAANIILHHHEKYDGSGYPHGLAGETIPLGSRIVVVVDAYDDLVTMHIYANPRSPQEALQEIIRGRGTHFDPFIVDIFVMHIKAELTSQIIMDRPTPTSSLPVALG